MIVLPILFIANVGLLPIGVALVVFAYRQQTPGRHCAVCQYDLRGSLGSVERCPECGAAFAEHSPVRRIDRAARIQYWVGIGLVAIPVVFDVMLGVMILWAALGR